MPTISEVLPQQVLFVWVLILVALDVDAESGLQHCQIDRNSICLGISRINPVIIAYRLHAYVCMVSAATVSSTSTVDLCVS